MRQLFRKIDDRILILTRNLLSIARANCSAFIFESHSFAEMESLFRNAPEFIFAQAWRETIEPDLAPARVRIMADETDLWMWADLTDDLPFNAATAPNQKTWELGDCLEIFLASSMDGPYYEMHVTPENQTLQLQADSRFETRPIKNGPLRSATWLHSKGWQVLASLPLELLKDEASGWISFGRYDYQSGRREPVLSSTSRHQKPDFHRRHEWTHFELENVRPAARQNAGFQLSQR